VNSKTPSRKALNLGRASTSGSTAARRLPLVLLCQIHRFAPGSEVIGNKELVLFR
jgi:hypothetical protein